MIIHWNPNPVFLALGPIHIRWYGLFFGGAFMAGLYIMKRIYHREELPSAELDPVFIYMVVGTILGARLGHCLFYDPVYYITHPVEILKVWEGGLASHGGALGILAALALFAARHGRPLLWLLDRLALPAAFGGALIRIGNFMNSEIVGLPTRTDWGVVFHRVDSLPRHPVQLYESAAYLLIFAFLILVYRLREDRPTNGCLAGLFLTAVFTARFFLEYVKLPQAAFPLFWDLRLGQILSVPFIFAGIALLVRCRRQNRPD